MKTKRVPFGRIPDITSKLTADELSRTAIKHSTRLGDDSTVKTWPNRQAMAKTIRSDERNRPCSEWNPVVKLTDGEGY